MESLIFGNGLTGPAGPAGPVGPAGPTNSVALPRELRAYYEISAAANVAFSSTQVPFIPIAQFGTSTDVPWDLQTGTRRFEINIDVNGYFPFLLPASESRYYWEIMISRRRVSAGVATTSGPYLVGTFRVPGVPVTPAMHLQHMQGNIRMDLRITNGVMAQTVVPMLRRLATYNSGLTFHADSDTGDNDYTSSSSSDVPNDIGPGEEAMLLAQGPGFNSASFGINYLNVPSSTIATTPPDNAFYIGMRLRRFISWSSAGAAQAFRYNSVASMRLLSEIV